MAFAWWPRHFCESSHFALDPVRRHRNGAGSKLPLLFLTLSLILSFNFFRIFCPIQLLYLRIQVGDGQVFSGSRKFWLNPAAVDDHRQLFQFPPAFSVRDQLALFFRLVNRKWRRKSAAEPIRLLLLAIEKRREKEFQRGSRFHDPSFS